MIVEGKGICFRTRVRLPSGPFIKKQGNPPEMASFLAFFMLFSFRFCRLRRSIRHIYHKNLVTKSVYSLPIGLRPINAPNSTKFLFPENTLAAVPLSSNNSL